MTERLLQAVTNDQVQKLFVEGANVDPKVVGVLAGALRDMEHALSDSTAREARIRDRIAAELAAKIEKKVEEARAGGIDSAVLDRAKELVRGVLVEKI